ncbi:MAG: ROK family protein [Stackebrandtia sp.]
MTALRSTGWARSPGGSSLGHLLDLIRSRPNWTRGQLLTETGLSRTTLTERLDMLFRAGLAYEGGSAASTGGRPASLIRFEDRGRVVLAIDLGHRHGQIAITDLDGVTLRQRGMPIDIGSPPAQLLGKVYAIADELLAEGDDEQLVGVGVGVPGPVSPATGRLTPIPIMPGWHLHPIVEEIESRWGAPALLENDARAYALGVAATRPEEATPLIAVKYSTGIGAGIMIDGHLLCGVDGAAGDIGHIRIVSGPGRRCSCGRTGCLAAYASGRALLGQVPRGTAKSIGDLAARALDDKSVASVVREGARLLGNTLASLVATVNPQAVVLGGPLGRLALVVDEVRAQIEAGVIDRVVAPLEVTAGSADFPATTGLAALVVGHVYAPDTVEAKPR